MNNPDMSPKQIMRLYGLKQALADVTLRELRVMFAKHNQRSWHRLMAEAQKVKLPHAPSSLRNMREQLIR